MKKLILISALFTFYFLLSTLNCNAQWQQTSDNGGTVNCFAIKGDTLFAGTDSGMFFSPNKGGVWVGLNNGISVNAQISSFAISGNNLFAGTGNGVYRSTDNGASWAAILANGYISALAANGNNIFAGAIQGLVWFSPNNGSSWNIVDSGLINYDLRSLIVKGDTVFAGTLSSNGSVFFSINNGTSWAPRNTGIPTSVGLNVLAESGNTLFAGTYNGLYLSTNNGSSWTFKGLNADILSLAVKGDTILAGTSNGVFLSPNNGVSWDEVNTGLPAGSSINALAIMGDTIFAGTSGSGIWFISPITYQLTANAGANKSIVCGGSAQLDTVTTNFIGTGDLKYKWSPASGLNYDTIPNPIATVTSNTTYKITVTKPNANSKADTAISSVTVTINPLIINTSDTSTTCGTAVTLSTTSNYTGSGIPTYSWQPTIGLSDATASDPLAKPGSTTTYTVTLTTSNGCVATNQATVTLNPLPTLEICYVEFDTATSKNSIHWETNLPANFDTVYIYTEVSTNVWSRIGSVPANQSNYIDVNSNPLNQSYSYKISVKDTCGKETDYSAFHTTVTLLSTYDSGTNTYGFSWSPYQGLTVPNYYLYGIKNSGDETLIGSVPGNQYFYNYTNPSLLFKKYFIGFNTPECSSKTNHLVKSNWVQSTTGINELINIDNLISIFPNPFNANFKIQTALQIKNIEITDITGRLLYTTTNKTIDFSSFTSGVYFVKVRTENGIAVKKVVKE